VLRVRGGVADVASMPVPQLAQETRASDARQVHAPVRCGFMHIGFL
jgi:hypothetical protein